MHQGYIPCKQGMVHCELHYVQYAVKGENVHQGNIPCKQGMVPCELHYAVNSGGKHASGIHTLQAGNGRL